MNGCFQSFNTQPPEGGWSPTHNKLMVKSFQHTAARRRLDEYFWFAIWLYFVSTHSRPKAAGANLIKQDKTLQFQHTAARRRLDKATTAAHGYALFQHTAARRRLAGIASHAGDLFLFQHTAARRRLDHLAHFIAVFSMFQHTAARRRLGRPLYLLPMYDTVSTHSRPKAAGAMVTCSTCKYKRFNTQPPEGGWISLTASSRKAVSVSTHSRPKAAGSHHVNLLVDLGVSTHSRPKAAGRGAASAARQ